MTFFNYFQIALIVIVVCVIATRAISSWVATGVNPIVIGRGQGSWRVLEFFSFDLGPTIVAHLDLAQFMMLLVIASFHELLAIPTPANGTYLLV